MPEIEERTAKIEGILDRISDLREEVSTLRADFNSLRQEVGDLRIHLSQQIQDNFRWTMVILIGSWVTIIAVILSRG